MTNCTTCGRQRTRVCDTCIDPTCTGCAVLMSLGNKADDYIECPTCAAERSAEEEHGPKSVSIKSIILDTEPRLSPGLQSMTTVWADGSGYRTRPWKHGGPA